MTVPHLLSGADSNFDEGIPLLQLESQHVPVPSQSEIKSPDDKKSVIVEVNEDDWIYLKWKQGIQTEIKVCTLAAKMFGLTGHFTK